MTALSLHRVRAELGSREVLHGVDFSVRPGEVLALVGPNGSGKTTALRCCYRALIPTAGAVVVDGTDSADLGRRELARTIGASTQEPRVSAGLTVRESVRSDASRTGHGSSGRTASTVKSSRRAYGRWG